LVLVDKLDAKAGVGLAGIVYDCWWAASDCWFVTRGTEIEF